MDFISALQVLRAHWLIVLCGGLITVAAVIGVVTQVPKMYSAQADYLLLIPDQEVTIAGEILRANPYVFFESGLSITAESVITSMQSDETAQEVADLSDTAKFEVSGTNGSAPVVAIQVDDADPETVLAVHTLLRRQIERFLTVRQSDVKAPKNQTIVSSPLRSPLIAQPSSKRVMRGALAAVIVGVFSTLAVVFVVDAATRRRSAREAPPDPEVA